MSGTKLIKVLRGNRGFTLIELLLVVGILGVLAAIAIQQYALYRMRSYDAIAEADLRNAATAEEAIYITAGSYLTCTDAATCETSLPGYRRSTGVTPGHDLGRQRLHRHLEPRQWQQDLELRHRGRPADFLRAVTAPRSRRHPQPPGAAAT